MDLSFNEKHLDIRQVPEADNPQAVVITTIRDKTGVRQGIGAARHDSSDKTFDPQALIDEATTRAISRATDNQENLCEQAPSSPCDAAKSSSSSTNSGYTGKHRTKPGSATENQLRALETMATERNQNLDDVTKQKYGMRPEEMSSQQADSLFKHFKARKG